MHAKKLAWHVGIGVVNPAQAVQGNESDRHATGKPARRDVPNRAETVTRRCPR